MRPDSDSCGRRPSRRASHQLLVDRWAIRQASAAFGMMHCPVVRVRALERMHCFHWLRFARSSEQHAPATSCGHARPHHGTESRRRERESVPSLRSRPLGGKLHECLHRAKSGCERPLSTPRGTKSEFIECAHPPATTFKRTNLDNANRFGRGKHKRSLHPILNQPSMVPSLAVLFGSFCLSLFLCRSMLLFVSSLKVFVSVAIFESPCLSCRFCHVFISVFLSGPVSPSLPSTAALPRRQDATMLGLERGVVRFGGPCSRFVPRSVYSEARPDAGACFPLHADHDFVSHWRVVAPWRVAQSIRAAPGQTPKLLDRIAALARTHPMSQRTGVFRWQITRGFLQVSPGRQQICQAPSGSAPTIF